MSMWTSPLAVLLGLLLVTLAAKQSNIPSYIQICKRNDPHIEDCILNSIERIRPELAKGIPELTVPAIEPLTIPEVVVSLGPPGSSIGGLGRNVRVRGPSRFKVTKLRVHLDTLEFIVGLHLPALNIDADYEVNARILLLPIKGKGRIYVNATDCTGETVLKAELVQLRGSQYMNFTSTTLHLDVGSSSARLDGLFNDNKALGEATSAAINESSDEFIKELKPVIEKSLAELLLRVANRITKKFTYDELFPLE